MRLVWRAVSVIALSTCGVVSACGDRAMPTGVGAYPPGPSMSEVARPRTLILVGNPDSMQQQERALVPSNPQASPGGWVYGDAGYSSLVGNNVEVVRDADGYRPVVRGFDFTFPFVNGFTTSGDPYLDTDAVLAQVFYWINVGHDYAWQHGFDEQAGSWQDDRFGRGGPPRHRIEVRAQSQGDSRYVGDGVITMGLLAGAAGGRRRDMGLDVEELLHEYFHALFESAIPPSRYEDPGHSLGGAVNESMADYFGASITGDPLFGEYSTGNAATGLDRHRLDANPQTFADFACGEPHVTGEVWSATLWDVRRAIGQNAADDRVLRALTVVTPPVTFLSMRDAILRADSVLGGAHRDALWTVFAARGFGWGATLRSCDDMHASSDLPVDLDYRVVPDNVVRKFPAARDTVIETTVRNTGATTWLAQGPRAVTLSYQWIDSAGGTVSVEQLQSALPHDVPAGATVTVIARLRTPATPGNYVLQWGLLQGTQWILRPQGTERIWVELTPSLLTGWIADGTPDSIVVGDTAFVQLRIVNEGSSTWSASGPTPVQISYHWESPARAVVVFDGARSALPHDVAPGDTVEVTAQLVAPPIRFGNMRVRWDMVQDGVAWFSWRGAPTLPRTLWVASRFGVVWLGADSAAIPTMTGDTALVAVRFRNAGRDTVGPGHTPISVSYHWLTPQGSAVIYDGIHTSVPTPVAPGDSTTVLVRVAGPPRAGDFTLSLDLVQEGFAWYSWAGRPTLDVRTVRPRNAVRWGSLPGGAIVYTGSAVAVSVSLQNSGGESWAATGDGAVQVGYHLRAANGSVLPTTSSWGLLPHVVHPGESVTVTLLISSPATPGTYYVVWDVLQKAGGWFSWNGSPTPTSPLTVLSRRER